MATLERSQDRLFAFKSNQATWSDVEKRSRRVALASSRSCPRLRCSSFPRGGWVRRYPLELAIVVLTPPLITTVSCAWL
jgi:hypothetical protein